MRIPVEKMILFKGDSEFSKGIAAAFKNHSEGRITKSEGNPIVVSYVLAEKKYVVLDGYHRIVKGLLEGKTEFECRHDKNDILKEMFWVPTVEQRYSPPKGLVTKKENKMKITKAKLKQIIKEELEVTLTNEEATEMFGEAVGAQLEEQELNEIDPSIMSEADKIALIVAALGKMAYNFSPAVFGTIAIMAARRAMGLDKPEEIEQVVQKTAAEMQPELKDIPWGTPPKQDYEKIDEM